MVLEVNNFVKFLNPDAVVVLRLSINLLVLSTSTVLVTTSTSVEQLSCGSSPLFDDLFGRIATAAYYRRSRSKTESRLRWRCAGASSWPGVHWLHGL